MTPVIRRWAPADREPVREVLELAFAGEPEVVALETALAARSDSFAFVAEVDRRVVGHVRLTRSWIDAEARVVDVLVLSPLAVRPEFQRQGIGAALAARAVEGAEAAAAPAVFLEGSPGYYGRLGWRPASDLGVAPPSVRIPEPAFQVVRLSRWEDSMRGALVYAETFWANDCVGLRGERLAAANQRAAAARAHEAPPGSA